jgi:hypothetical protein
MVVMAADPPTRLLPPAANPTEELLTDLLYDPLYRLDDAFQPVPELARDLPEVSKDGLTWRIPIKADARFHNGQKVTPEDVMFSLRMAASPSCPLGRDLCAAVRDHMASSPEREEDEVIVTLTEPHAPFLVEALGRLPILSEAAVTSATADLIAAADRLSQDRPDEVVDAITEQMLRAACADAEPPDGCRLTDHRPQLERIFSRAGLELPSEVPYTDQSGLFDEDAYVGQLLERLAALGQVFTTTDADKRSAALGLLDATVAPLGGGPYRLSAIEEDGDYVLVANREHTRTAPMIDRIVIDVERDPSVAVTRLLGGEADWILEVGQEFEEAVAGIEGVSAAPRPLDLQYGILFNVRPERVYFDREARRAFALCLDQEALATRLDPERAIATTPYTASSWALPEATPQPRDVASSKPTAAARRGWRAGARRTPALLDHRGAPHQCGSLHLRQRGRRRAGRMWHRARRGGARPDRGHHARPAALAQRLRYAAAGSPARPGPRQRCAHVRVLAHHHRAEPGGCQPKRLHLIAGRPPHQLRARDARPDRASRGLRRRPGPAGSGRALLAAVVRVGGERALHASP